MQDLLVDTQISNRRKLKKQFVRLSIIQSSEELFLEKGYRATTIDEIAERAGVTKKTLYSYFPSKLALYVYMFDNYLEHLSAQISRTAALDLPGGELMTRLFEVLFEFTKKNERFMHLYWMLDTGEFNASVPKELISRVSVLTDLMFRNTLPVIKRAQEEGLVREYDPRLLIHLMSAINKGIFTHTHKERRFEIAEIDPDALFGLLNDILGKGLLRGPEK